MTWRTGLRARCSTSSEKYLTCFLAETKRRVIPATNFWQSRSMQKNFPLLSEIKEKSGTNKHFVLVLLFPKLPTVSSEANRFSPQLLHGPQAEIFLSLLWRIYRPYLSELETGTRLNAANLTPFSQPDGYKFNKRAPVFFFFYWIHRLYLKKHTYLPDGVVILWILKHCQKKITKAMVDSFLRSDMQNHIASKPIPLKILMQRKTWVFTWYVRLE